MKINIENDFKNSSILCSIKFVKTNINHNFNDTKSGLEKEINSEQILNTDNFAVNLSTNNMSPQNCRKVDDISFTHESIGGTTGSSSIKLEFPHSQINTQFSRPEDKKDINDIIEKYNKRISKYFKSHNSPSDRYRYSTSPNNIKVTKSKNEFNLPININDTLFVQEEVINLTIPFNDENDLRNPPLHKTILYPPRMNKVYRTLCLIKIVSFLQKAWRKFIKRKRTISKNNLSPTRITKFNIKNKNDNLLKIISIQQKFRNFQANKIWEEDSDNLSDLNENVEIKNSNDYFSNKTVRLNSLKLNEGKAIQLLEKLETIYFENNIEESKSTNSEKIPSLIIKSKSNKIPNIKTKKNSDNKFKLKLQREEFEDSLDDEQVDEILNKIIKSKSNKILFSSTPIEKFQLLSLDQPTDRTASQRQFKNRINLNKK